MVKPIPEFAGRTFVVTGGLGVLGRHVALALAGRGANLVILDRSVDAAATLLQQGEAGTASRLLLHCADVTNRESLEQACRATLDRFGRVDGLINAAGGNHPDATTATDRPFFGLSADVLRHVIDLNLLGTILPSQVFGQQMAAQGEGAILNITSMTADRPLTRIPAYSVSKAAVTNFTRWLAVHMAQEYSPAIRVNAVAPGFFLTTQNAYLLQDATTGGPTARGQAILAHTPMRRFGTPEDLVGTVLWLLSPASAFVTGAVIPVDGGFGAFSGV